MMSSLSKEYATDRVIISCVITLATALFLVGLVGPREDVRGAVSPTPKFASGARRIESPLSAPPSEQGGSRRRAVELGQALEAIVGRETSLAGELWRGQDWRGVSPDWIPSARSMEYWVRLRLDQIQEIVGDDEEKAASYGWEREWPPYEGFPTPSDYARLTCNDLGAFGLVMEYKTTQALISDIQDRATTREARKKLKRLWLGYEPLIASAYDRIGDGDAFPGWNDLIRLGGRMGIE